MGPEAPDEILMLERDIESIESRFEAIFDYWSEVENQELSSEYADLIASRMFLACRND